MDTLERTPLMRIVASNTVRLTFGSGSKGNARGISRKGRGSFIVIELIWNMWLHVGTVTTVQLGIFPSPLEPLIFNLKLRTAQLRTNKNWTTKALAPLYILQLARAHSQR